MPHKEGEANLFLEKKFLVSRWILNIFYMKQIETRRSYARHRKKALDQMKLFFRENDKLGRYQIFLWKILLKEAKLASERKLY